MIHAKCAKEIGIGRRPLAQTGFLCLCLLIFISAMCTDAFGQPNSREREAEGTKRTWHDGKRWRSVWMVHDEIAIFRGLGETWKGADVTDQETTAKAVVQEVVPGATLEKTIGLVSFYGIPKIENSESIILVNREISNKIGIQYASPVFYPGVRSPESRMALTGEIIVGFKEPQTEQSMEEFAARYGMTLVKRFRSSPRSALFDARKAADTDTLTLSNSIFSSGEVSHAYPNWLREIPMRPPKNDTRPESNRQDHHRSLDLGTGVSIQKEKQSTAKQLAPNRKIEITSPHWNAPSIQEEVQSSSFKAQILKTIPPQVKGENQGTPQRVSATPREENGHTGSIESIPVKAEETHAGPEEKEN